MGSRLMLLFIALAFHAQSAFADPPIQIDSGVKFTLLDVREPHEYQIAQIPGSVLIPLGDVVKRAGELDKDADIVVHCKMGGRSAKAIEALKPLGFTKLTNLKGGITAWSNDVDPSVPKY